MYFSCFFFFATTSNSPKFRYSKCYFVQKHLGNAILVEFGIPPNMNRNPRILVIKQALNHQKCSWNLPKHNFNKTFFTLFSQEMPVYAAQKISKNPILFIWVIALSTNQDQNQDSPSKTQPFNNSWGSKESEVWVLWSFSFHCFTTCAPPKISICMIRQIHIRS